jgi:hypothetical protein
MTTEELCNLVLRRDLVAYTQDKRQIPESALRVGRYEYRKTGENWLTGAPTIRSVLVETRNIPIDKLEPYVKYFQYDDVMNYALDHSLPLPCDASQGDEDGFSENNHASNEERPKHIDRKKTVLIDGYREAASIYEAVKCPSLNPRNRIETLKNRALNHYKRSKYKHIKENMLKDDELYKSKRDTIINFIGRLLLKILHNQGIEAENYRQTYREARGFAQSESLGSEQALTPGAASRKP